MPTDVHPGGVVRAVSAAAERAPRARYLPIAEHGLIGDLHTVALVGTDGTIDWYCCPRFDSPSVFAAILDADRGGLFRISPDCGGWRSKQLYLPDTNILITRFLMPEGVGEVQDFMPPPRSGAAAHRHRMIRRILAVRGPVRFLVDVAPRFEYARARHEVALTPHGALFRSPELTLGLSTRCPFEIVEGRDVRARIELQAGETATFVLDRVEPGETPVAYSDADVAAEVEIFRLAAQVLGTQRNAAATSDGTGYVVQTDAGPQAAPSLNDAIRLARDHIGRFLHEADRRHATWGLLVQVGEVSAVYGDWPLLPAAGPPSTRRTSLVARIRDRWRGGSASSALENALEIVRAYAATGGRDAA